MILEKSRLNFSYIYYLCSKNERKDTWYEKIIVVGYNNDAIRFDGVKQ